MRDITFRAKRKDNGDWVYGVPLKEGYSQEVEMLWYEYSSLAYTERVQVIPETVGQYTGLLDKDVKKVFEGDIIKADNWLHSYMKIYTIVFEDGGFYAKYKDEDGWNFDHLANIEVIGNIHDNKELLEVK